MPSSAHATIAARCAPRDDGGTAFDVPARMFVRPAGRPGRGDIIEPVEKLYVTIEEETT